jgi:hypothetical protein
MAPSRRLFVVYGRIECRMASAISLVGPASSSTSSSTIAKMCSLPYWSASSCAVAKNANQSSGVHASAGLGNRHRSSWERSGRSSATMKPLNARTLLPQYGPKGRPPRCGSDLGATRATHHFVPRWHGAWTCLGMRCRRRLSSSWGCAGATLDPHRLCRLPDVLVVTPQRTGESRAADPSTIRSSGPSACG